MDKRLIVPLLITVLILVIFKQFIEDLAVKYLVDPIFQHAQRGIVQDFIWVLLVLALSHFAYSKEKINYVVSDRVMIVLLVFTVIYLYFRIFDNTFSFTPLFVFKKVYYLDLIPISFLSYGYLTLNNFIRSKFRKPFKDEVYNHNAFIIDDAINVKKEDTLSRYDSAVEIAQRIINTRNEKAFAIAITGKWGSGKTSFINLMKESLKDRKSQLKIIDFGPWKSHNSTSLIENFFEKLASGLEEYSSEFNDLTKSYSKKLINKDSQINNLINIITLSGEQDLDELYSRINQVIKKLNKRIIVFFDDLDRLNKEEIYEVLKLIRNTADFYNVSYIATFDKKYFHKSLNELIPDYSSSFQEKIFQFEFPLPFVEETNIIKFIETELIKAFPDKKSEIESGLYADGLHHNILYTHSFNSLRSAKRFLNDFIYKYYKIKEEVNFHDFFNLVVLKMEFHFVFEDLFYNKDFYLDYFRSTEKRYSIITTHRKETKSLKEYLEDNLEPLSIDKAQINTVLDVISSIFRRNLFSSKKGKFLISEPENFDKYFRLYISANEIPETEFNEAIKLSYEDFIEKIKYWIAELKGNSLVDKFEKIKPSQGDCECREDFEKIIKVAFFLRKLNDSNNMYYYPDENIFDKICDYGNKIISKKFYNGDEERFKAFLEALFVEAEFPFIEANIISTILSHTSSEIVIPKDKLKEILTSYFIKMLSDSKSGYNNYEIYGHLNLNIKHGNISTIIPAFIKHLQEGFLKYFLRHIINVNKDGFEEAPPEEWEYYIHNLIPHIFGTFDDFDAFLKPYKEPEVIEFYKFLQEYKANKFKPVKFQFEHIKI